MMFEEKADDDPLVDLLAVPRASNAADPLRDIVLMQAAGVLRRRRWVRCGGQVVVLAICYFAGLATMAFVRNEAAPAVALQREQHDAGPREALDEADRVATQITQSSEILADQITPTRASFGFYRSAGDFQLLQRGDLQAAVRLYSQALELASPADLTISAGSDSWLLMSLKQSRLQDGSDVHDEG